MYYIYLRDIAFYIFNINSNNLENCQGTFKRLRGNNFSNKGKLINFAFSKLNLKKKHFLLSRDVSNSLGEKFKKIRPF